MYMHDTTGYLAVQPTRIRYCCENRSAGTLMRFLRVLFLECACVHVYQTACDLLVCVSAPGPPADDHSQQRGASHPARLLQPGLHCSYRPQDQGRPRSVHASLAWYARRPANGWVEFATKPVEFLGPYLCLCHDSGKEDALRSRHNVRHRSDAALLRVVCWRADCLFV